ncbi:hypothetical protein [Paraburkholderia sp. UYCP14C]|uniref:hypothetical protein n=1 Tax=Paraburkholderia sp. UYCP14C TaxID=2511130 RepID=UPI001B7D60A0|nr:hypothetical protein [Paraburkholderia sp. UYCP14C]
MSATFLGVYCTTLAEMFPKRSRATSLAVVNNVVVLIFGGFAQTFVTWLIALTGSPLAPVLYVISASRSVSWPSLRSSRAISGSSAQSPHKPPDDRGGFVQLAF